jgi:hypothetical protein
MVNADWVRAEQECFAHSNPQPLISWQRRDGAQIQVKRGLIRVKIGSVLRL